MRRLIFATLACTMAFAFAPSCVLVADEGASVALTLSTLSTEAESADGIAVSLHDVQLSIVDAGIVACEERAAISLGIRKAHALHPDGRGDHLGAPQIVPLAEGERALGVLNPGVGRYCELVVYVAPSEELEGWTLTATGSASEAELEVRGYAMRVWRLPLREPLIVDASSDVAALRLELDLAEALGATSFAERDPDEIGLDLLLALEESARIERAAPERG